MNIRPSLIFVLLASAIFLSGCLSTMPTMGGGEGSGTVTGSAAGSSNEGVNSQLESCDSTLGTLSVFEDRSLPWWSTYRSRVPDLGSTVPVIRLMIQQSNCFVIVERGAAMKAIERERKLMESGDTREGSDFGKGQMVAADYTLSPSVQLAAKDTGGVGGMVGGLLGGKVGALVGGGLSKNEAATTMLLIDNRSGVQVSAAVGNAKNYDFKLFGGLLGSGIAGAGAYSNTPEGKIITASFADSYNQMVKALRNYKTQNVEGGLGKGGSLKVGE